MKRRVTGMGGIFFHARDPATLRPWSIAAADGVHFVPGQAPFMINYRMEGLAALLQALRVEGCNVLDRTEDPEYGKFGWVIDPEGNKVELWEPPPGE